MCFVLSSADRDNSFLRDYAERTKLSKMVSCQLGGPARGPIT